jgi:hypothetical protein
MKDLKTKQKFLELRAQRKSFRAIEEEVGISRRTQAIWEKEYKEELEHLKAVELEAVLERYRLTVKDMVEQYCIDLQRVNEELQRRDLADVPTPKLYDIKLKLHARIDEMSPVIILHDYNEPEEDEELSRVGQAIMNETTAANPRAREIIYEIWELEFSRSGTTGKPLPDDLDKGARKKQLADEFIDIAFSVSPTALDVHRNEEADRAAQGL